MIIITTIPTEIYTDTIKNIACDCKQYIALCSIFFLHIKMQIEKTLVFQNAYKYAHYR